MKYVIGLETPDEVAAKLLQNPEEVLKEMEEMLEQCKAEVFASTIRRFTYIVVNIEDPHVEGRRLFEKLSRWGKVTIEPVSTYEEFLLFLKKG